MLDLYREQILERSRSPRFAGELASATHSGDGANQSCGDEVHVDLEVVDGMLKTIRHRTRACSVCAAAADLLAENLEGRPLGEVREWNAEKVTDMIGIPLSPVRLKCALLPLESLKNALGD